jgi:Ca-activated chloride channel family protein
LHIARSRARWRRLLAGLCAALAVAAILAAATRPFVEVEPTGDDGILELVIDASGSMQTDDVAPTRLNAADHAVLRLLDRLPERLPVGLVSFSVFPETQALPTTDHDALRERIAPLKASGSSALDQGLRLALQDIQASHQATSASILLISDGLMAGDPVAVARVAAARHVKILAVALGRPDATVTARDEAGVLQRIRVPPDLFTLTRTAETTGGHAIAARSAAELETALDDLVVSSRLDGAGRGDLTLLFVAVAAVLLAIGRALTPPQPASSPTGWRWLSRARWARSVALLLVAATATIGWTHERSSAASAASARSAVLAKLAAQPAPAPPPPPPAPPFVAVSGTKADRAIVQQAARLLRAHRALAPQRTSEIKRQHLKQLGELEVSACDVCRDAALASSNVSIFATINGQRSAA